MLASAIYCEQGVKPRVDIETANRKMRIETSVPAADIGLIRPSENDMKRHALSLRQLMLPIALPFSPWWLMWVAAISSAWLLPTHFNPWRAFHSDMVMTMALLLAAFWVVLHSRQPMQVHVTTLVALGTACIPVLQWATGMIAFDGDAWIAGMYLFGFALALSIGARFEQTAPGKLGDALFAAIGIAAVLSTGLAIYQWLRLSGLGLAAIELSDLPGYRPYANLGQPNNLATLLVWGLLALCWGHRSGRMRGWIAAGAAAFVLIGIASTQSRTAWVQLVFVAIGLVAYRRQLHIRQSAVTVLALGGFFGLLVLGWETINGALYLSAPLTLEARLEAGLRPLAWQIFTDALSRRPWFGWGWNQIAIAQSFVALDHPALGYTFDSAHNLFLDLLLQMGVPLGGALALGLIVWLCFKAPRVATAQSCLSLLAVVVLLVHAMLEFPQAYAYFLLPVGLMMGALDSMHPPGPVARLPRWLAVVALGIAGALLSLATTEYLAVEKDLQRLRFEAARIGPSTHSSPPDVRLLTQLGAFLQFSRLRSESNMSEQDLELTRKIAERFPSDRNLLRYALAAALNGQPSVAGNVLTRLCLMNDKQRCNFAIAAWREMASTTHPVLSSVALPDAR